MNIQCDLIVHSRGNNYVQDNLLAIEMKKSYRREESKNSDKIRLRALTKSTYDQDIWAFDGKSFPEHVCRYILGVFYEIDEKNRQIFLEYYRNGELQYRRKILIDYGHFHSKNYNKS